MLNYFNKLIDSYSVLNERDCDKIKFISENPDIIINLCKLRDEAHFEALDKANQLAYDYLNDFPGKKMLNPFLNVEKYIIQCQHLVTVYLFQSPFIKTNSDLERYINYDLYRDWKPNDYVLAFCKKIKEIIK